MDVSENHNREAIAELLQREPVANADQLGYLDETYDHATRWFGLSEHGLLRTVVLVYRGLSRPGVFTAGAPGGLRPIFRSPDAQMPERATGHFVTAHRDAVLTAFDEPEPLRPMSRMVLHREVFVDQSLAGPDVVQLGHADTADIMALYAHWPDNFFEPFQLESGLYFGVRSDRGLAAIAGIHNLSCTYDVATIGNLVTHPDHRGKGLGTAVTARLLAATFQHVSRVTLDVAPENAPAVRTYRRFGFAHAAEFFEGELHRK